MKTSLTLAPRNGLANRIRAISSGIALAGMIRADLSLVWSLDFHLNCPYEMLFMPDPAIISVENYPNEKEDLESYMQSKAFDRFILAKEVKSMKEENYNFLELGKYTSLFMSSGASFLRNIPAWQFQPEESIGKNVKEMTSRFAKHMIGVHIRRGDNLESIAKSPIEGFYRRMDTELAENRRTAFFLATDSPEEEDKIRKRYPDRVISFAKKSLDRNEPGAIQEAMVDLLCLAATSRIIGSYWSSFSQLAAKIGNIKVVEVKETI